MAIEPEPRLLNAFSSLEIRHLLALDAVATEGTFGRAAERLGYTQSAVSQQIAALERAIGGAVFDRPGGPKPVRITPLGKLVLAHARELLDRAQATAEAIERFKAGEGRIDIGTFQSVSNVLLPQIVMQLRDEHPAVDIRVFEEDTAVERLLAGELDLTYWVGPLDGPIESVKLLDDPYVLVSRRGDFPDGPVRCEQLDGVQMVSFPRLLCDMGRVEDTFAALGVEPLIVFRTADNGAVTVDGPRRHGRGGDADAGDRHRPRRRRAVHPRAGADDPPTRGVCDVAGRAHAVATGPASHRHLGVGRRATWPSAEPTADADVQPRRLTCRADQLLMGGRPRI